MGSRAEGKSFVEVFYFFLTLLVSGVVSFFTAYYLSNYSLIVGIITQLIVSVVMFFIVTLAFEVLLSNEGVEDSAAGFEFVQFDFHIKKALKISCGLSCIAIAVVFLFLLR